MVLAGAEDILIPMNLSRKLYSLIPGAAFATAKGGHAFMWEHPKPFNEAVLGLHRKTPREIKEIAHFGEHFQDIAGYG